MNDWLDSWTNAKRLSAFQAAKRFATRAGHSADVALGIPEGYRYALADTKEILAVGKRASARGLTISR